MAYESTRLSGVSDGKAAILGEQAEMNAVLESAQFDTVEAALRFAFRQNRENYQLSLLNRMASSPGQPGRGLGGLEGAATAGIINRHVAALGFGPSAILRAKYGQREIRCNCGSDCCSRKKESEVWLSAVAEVASFAAAAVTLSKYPIRHAQARKYCGGGLKRSMQDLYKDCGVTQRSGEEQSAKVKQFLKHHDGAAFHLISANLREAGIVYTAD